MTKTETPPRKQYTAESIKTDAAKRTVTATISTEAVDRDNEIMLAKGADLVNFRKNPVVLWAHNYGEPPIAKAAGGVSWIKRVPGGLAARMEFAETEFADEIFGLYEGGFLKAFSIGFNPTESKEPTEDDIKKHPEWEGVRRVYTRWELLEFSAVPVPANPEALVTAVGKGILSAESAEKMGVSIVEAIWTEKLPLTEGGVTIPVPEPLKILFDPKALGIEPEPATVRRIITPKAEPKPIKRRLITLTKKGLLSREQVLGFIKRALDCLRGRCD